MSELIALVVGLVIGWRWTPAREVYKNLRRSGSTRARAYFAAFFIGFFGIGIRVQ